MPWGPQGHPPPPAGAAPPRESLRNPRPSPCPSQLMRTPHCTPDFLAALLTRPYSARQPPQDSKCNAFPAKTGQRHAVARAHGLAVKQEGAPSRSRISEGCQARQCPGLSQPGQAGVDWNVLVAERTHAKSSAPRRAVPPGDAGALRPARTCDAALPLVRAAARGLGSQPSPGGQAGLRGPRSVCHLQVPPRPSSSRGAGKGCRAAAPGMTEGTLRRARSLKARPRECVGKASA